MLEAISQRFRNLVINNRYYKFVELIEDPLSNTNRTPRRTMSQLEKYNFQGTGKTTGRGYAIASKERHFSPLAAILENRSVTLFH
jgi:hypothetical protein